MTADKEDRVLKRVKEKREGEKEETEGETRRYHTNDERMARS